MKVIKKIKKIFKVIIDILTFIMFLALILIIIAKLDMTINNRDYFSMFGYSFFKVATGSMEPNIKENDIIVVQNNKSFNIGDVITYKENDAYITHRLISMDGNNLVTKGDANNASDAAITSDRVIGVVVKDYHNLEVWHKIFTTPSILISLFVTLILFDFAFSYKPKEKVEKDIKKAIKIKEEPIVNVDIAKPKIKFNDLEKQKILELTQRIELPKLKAMIKDNDMPKLSDAEITSLDNKLKNKDSLPRLKEKEKEFLDYTIRLDLKELQSKINTKIKKR